MPRFVVSINDSIDSASINAIKNSIVETSAKEEVQVKIDNNTIFLYTYLSDEMLKGERFFSNEEWAVLFLGEVIDFKTVPFQNIIEVVKNKSFEEFKKFNGIFAIIVINKTKDKYYIIGDRRGQFPIYYGFNKDSLIIASELSPYCRLFENAEFNERWLYDYMYFNFPIGGETFLKDVSRLPYSPVLEYCNTTKEIKIINYADVFRRKEQVIKGQDGLDYAKEVFSNRVPLYFEESKNIACAVTGGWDGRTNISLAPDKNAVTAYTYGGENCHDFIYSNYIVKALGINHKKIVFDEKLIPELPGLISDTVYFTSGLQSIQRATLLKVYSLLSDFQVIISGIHYDGLFRGHIGGPSIITDGIRNIFKTGKKNIIRESFKDMFKIDYKQFSDHINYKIDKLEEVCGNLQTSEGQSIFNNYIMYPNYFAGEYKVAERFSTLRIPGWDLDIIDLSFSIEQSSLTYSEYAGNKRGNRKSMMLQAYLISQFAPELKSIPTLSMTTPKVVLTGDIAFKRYYFYRNIINKFNNTFIYRNQKPLEDWENWLNVEHIKFIDDLIFSKDSLIQNYFTESYLNQIKVNRDHRIVGKLSTVEIILRLIKNKWQRFW